jgi:hypothetical protein
MVRGLHRVIAIVTALALWVSSAGWSVASVQVGFPNAMHQHGATKGKPGGHAPHKGAKSTLAVDACHDGPSYGHVHAPNEGASCCAMACDVAVALGEYFVPVVDPPSRLKRPLVEDDVPTELLTRLDRPPRRMA